MTETERELLAGAAIPPPANNGAPPDPAPAPPPAAANQLPEGTIQLPPSLVARLTRLMQETPAIHDVLYAFIEGKGVTGQPLSLVVPVVLLMPPQPPKEG